MAFSLSHSIVENFKTCIVKACCEDGTILQEHNLGVSESVS
jgi:hypothetical protein